MTADNRLRLRFDFLGLIRIVDEKWIQLDVERPAQHRPLSMLAMGRGHRVSTDVLIDRSWPDGPPDTGSVASTTGTPEI